MSGERSTEDHVTALQMSTVGTCVTDVAEAECALLEGAVIFSGCPTPQEA